MTINKCHILRLPAELLALISNRIQSSDLCSFRQTCTTFAEVACDEFASHYFAEICCFFPDPARLQRLYDIASQPHLAKHIQIVYLTLDPFEYKDDAISFVVPAHDRGDTLLDYKERYKVEKLEYCCSQRPDLSLVTSSLAHLDPLRNHVHVDLGSRHYFYNHIEWAIISQQCLAAVAQAVFPIYDLTILSLTDIHDPYPHVDGGTREFQNITTLPHRLYCTPIHLMPPGSVPSALRLERLNDYTMPDMNDFPQLPEDAESLGMIFWRRVPSCGSDLAPFANAVLSRNQSKRLRQVTLVRVPLDDFEPLFHLLQQCRNTLEAILLHEVEIVSKTSGLWRKLFELLIAMPGLNHLNLRELWLGRSRSAPLAILGPATQSAWNCHAVGHSSVRRALEDVMEHPPRIRSRSSDILSLW